MPHFLDWFVPVYLVISVLILVGFGACIYYFEPGLQEAHKWRMQRPLVDRDLRKTLMVRDNLAFGGPELRVAGSKADPGKGPHLEKCQLGPAQPHPSGLRLGTGECAWWDVQRGKTTGEGNVCVCVIERERVWGEGTGM
uniref:Uncharacterized protein n=1 Tax=Equus asinus TaxID=9793 RepID=A0A8C4L086_EQUAS